MKKRAAVRVARMRHSRWLLANHPYSLVTGYEPREYDRRVMKSAKKRLASSD